MGVLPSVKIIPAPLAMAEDVELLVEVLAKAAVLDIPPASVHESVNEGNVLEDEAACVISCTKLTRKN